jgi:hypothetical protein
MVSPSAIDGFVKSPSAALRGNSFSAVPEGLAPQGPHSSVFARLASGAFYETISSAIFNEPGVGRRVQENI